MAKIASGVGKPDGLALVPPGDEAAFLAPMSVGKLWGVGLKTEARLLEMGVKTVSDLARLPLAALKERFGEHHGLALYRHSRGEDDSEVVTDHEPKQLSQEETFQHDVADPRRLWEAIRTQTEKLSERLQRDGLAARTITLKLRYSDFTTVTRSVTRTEPTSSAEDIAASAAALVRSNWVRSRPIRLIGIACSILEAQSDWRQLRLLS